MKWQPIETAPTDVSVIVGSPKNESVSAILVNECGSLRWCTNADLFECFHPQLQFTPTRWMPLPEPPEAG